MIASDLLHSRVFDSEGRDLGHVADLRAVEVGRARGKSKVKDLEVDWLLVGATAHLLRLGYHGHGMKGPVGLSWLVRRLHGYVVPWSAVATLHQHEIRLSVPASELERLTD